MFIHVKEDHIMPGLPAGTLDRDDLTPDQQRLLDLAVERGIYREVEPTDRPDYHNDGWTDTSGEESDHAETASG